MKIGALIRIEMIKTVKRRAFWVAAAFLALVCSVAIISSFVQGRKGFGAPFVAPYAWAMTASDAGPMPAFFLALTIVMLVTGEFTWRTARQNVIDGLSKEQFFVAKWLMTMLVAVAFMAIPFAIATGTSLYGRINGATPTAQSSAADSATAAKDRVARDEAMTAANDSTRKALEAARTSQDSANVLARRKADSTQAALRQALRDARSTRPAAAYPAPDANAPLISLNELKVAGGFALGSLGIASMAFMLAILLRSTGGGVGVFFLYFAFLESLIGLAVRQLGSAEIANKVMPYFPLAVLRGPINPANWHPGYVERLNTIAASMGQPPRVIEPDMFKLVGLPMIWIAVFVLIAFVSFRQRDL